MKRNKIILSRITSSGSFIPEIDGLRFIAILSVVLFHIYGFIGAKDVAVYTHTFNSSLLNRLLSNGAMGVPLFFVLSGFILGLPFAKYHLQSGKKVNLKSYFYRRITRLEPPYIVVMTLLLFATVLMHKLAFAEAIKSFFASITYTHNFIYGAKILPLLNTVTWSLEIEIQFYVLAPLLALFFIIKNKIRRRLLLAFSIVFFTAADYYIHPPFISIIDYMEYFLIGLLLVDVYIESDKKGESSIVRNSFSVLLLFFIFYFDKGDFNTIYQKIIWELVLLASIFVLYYNVLLRQSIKLLSKKVITNIGGMCYTIYLLHYTMISFVGNPLLNHQFSKYAFVNIGIYFLILIGCVLLVSIVFFVLIERPCMDKHWVTKLKAYVRKSA